MSMAFSGPSEGKALGNKNTDNATDERRGLWQDTGGTAIWTKMLLQSGKTKHRKLRCDQSGIRGRRVASGLEGISSRFS